MRSKRFAFYFLKSSHVKPFYCINSVLRRIIASIEIIPGLRYVYDSFFHRLRNRVSVHDADFRGAQVHAGRTASHKGFMNEMVPE